MLPATSRSFGPPRGFCATALEWSRQNQDKNCCYKEVYPSSSFNRTPAKTLEGKPPLAFTAGLEEVPPQYVCSIPNGRVYGDDVVIVGDDDKIILDLSMIFAPFYHSVFYKLKLPAVSRIDGPVLVLACAPGNNYGHWLHQVLPRIHLVQRAGLDLRDVQAFLINECSGSFILQSMELLGIPKEKCRFMSPRSHFESNMLIVPSIPPGGNPPTWVFDFLRQAFIKDPYDEAASAPIYVSRRNASRRKFSNEQDVEDVMHEYGVRAIVLESLTFSEQVHVFRQASAVISIHGSGLTNMAFCKPGTKIIEILSPSFPEICWWTMASQLGHDYYFLLGKGDRQDFPTDVLENWKDIECDIDLLRRTMDAAGLRKH